MINEIDSVSLREKIAAGGEIQVIDIRSPAELAEGMLPGAQSVPMHLIPLRWQDLPKDREVVLYCRSGARSYHACQYLIQQGLDQVLNLRGGIAAWARHGFEIEPPAARY